MAPGWRDHTGPLVASWNLETGAVTRLRPDRPTCPYRSFRQTAVTGETGDKILGLLDRLRLHCWDGRTASCVFTVDLAATMVRDDMDQAWLAVSPHFTLTVHQDLDSVTVVSAQGRVLTTIVPDLPALHQHQDWRVTEVVLHHTLVFIRLHRDSPDSSCNGLILKCDLTCVLTRPGEGNSPSTPATLVSSQAHCEGSGSRLFVQDTKLVSVNTDLLQVEVFNYFDQ